jgi:GNAT superfamily N-acetyltransferase
MTAHPPDPGAAPHDPGAPAVAPPPGWRIRRHRIGDLGWVVHRQAVLYAQEYGWDGTFEALLAEIAARFIREFDPASEVALIAERGAEVVGAAFVVRAGADVAQLRMVYVEPSARGLGIGRALVAACIDFARERGYATMTLWTNDVLVSARRIYEAAGFRLQREEQHRSFGADLVGQYWTRPL